MVNKLLSPLARQLFPHRCVLCGLASDRDLPLCRPCQRDLRANTHCCRHCALPLTNQGAPGGPALCGQCVAAPVFDRARVPWLYDEYLAHLIHRWKFGGEYQLSTLLASLWLDRTPAPTPVDALVPVPLHWRRRWYRGYNQSALLASELKRQCHVLGGTQIAAGLLRRIRATAPQSGQSARERRRNLRGVFTVRRACDNLRLAVVDDVLTTGATAAEAAAALRNAGAGHIEIWCLARTPVEHRSW
jgi:ComF family protein